MRLFSSFGNPAPLITLQIYLGDDPSPSTLYPPVNPGDRLHGHVAINLSRPTKALSVIIAFLGKVSTTIDKKHYELLLFRKELVLWGTRRNANKARGADFWPKVMSAGNHRFPFTFNVPTSADVTSGIPGTGSGGLPTSLNDEDLPYGTITYVLTAVHTRPSFLIPPIILKDTLPIKLVELIDTHQESLAQPRSQAYEVEMKADKDLNVGNGKVLKKGEGGLVKAKIELAKAGFLRGESIQLTINVNHVAPIKQIDGARISLVRIAKFTSPKKERIMRKDIRTVQASILCDPKTLSTTIRKSLPIPTTIPPTIVNGHLISLTYELDIVLNLSMSTTVFDASSKRRKKNLPPPGTFSSPPPFSVIFAVPLVLGTEPYSASSRPRGVVRIESASEIIPVLRTCTVESLQDNFKTPVHSPISVPASTQISSIIIPTPSAPPAWDSLLLEACSKSSSGQASIHRSTSLGARTLGENLLAYNYSLRRPSAPDLSEIYDESVGPKIKIQDEKGKDVDLKLGL